MSVLAQMNNDWCVALMFDAANEFLSAVCNMTSKARVITRYDALLGICSLSDARLVLSISEIQG